MVDYKEFFGVEHDAKPHNGEVINGTFSCQDCSITSEEAIYNQNTKILSWTCPDGHRNVLKDFKLF